MKSLTAIWACDWCHTEERRPPQARQPEGWSVFEITSEYHPAMLWSLCPVCLRDPLAAIQVIRAGGFVCDLAATEAG